MANSHPTHQPASADGDLARLSADQPNWPLPWHCDGPEDDGCWTVYADNDRPFCQCANERDAKHLVALSGRLVEAAAGGETWPSEEAVARAICKSQGISPDMCVFGSGAIMSNPDGTTASWSECSRYAWEDRLVSARAVLALFPAHPPVVAGGEAKPDAWRWRYRWPDGPWSDWIDGRPRRHVNDRAEYEEQPLYAHPPADTAPGRDAEIAGRSARSIEASLARHDAEVARRAEAAGLQKRLAQAEADRDANGLAMRSAEARNRELEAERDNLGESLQRETKYRVLAQERAEDAEAALATAQSRPSGDAALREAVELIGSAQEWKDKLAELYTWSGSAWIAGEKVSERDDDMRAGLYSFLCSLIGWLITGEECAKALAVLAAQDRSAGGDAASEGEPVRIWLEPRSTGPFADGFGANGRSWCETDDWEGEGVEYVRADLAPPAPDATTAAREDALEEAARICERRAASVASYPAETNTMQAYRSRGKVFALLGAAAAIRAAKPSHSRPEETE